MDTVAIPTNVKITVENAASMKAETLAEIAAKAKVSKNQVIKRASFTDSNNKLTVILRRTNEKYRVSVAYRLGKKTTVGCRSTHDELAGANSAFDGNCAQAKKLGWKTFEKPSKAARNPDGAFTMATFPQPGQKAVPVKEPTKAEINARFLRLTI